jgi:hypothetical protein
MRASAWVTILAVAGFAVACGDQPTEPLPDREARVTLVPGGGVQFATSSSGDGYSITTDKDDYQPGDRVVLTGAGWSPYDVLDIVLTDEPQTHPAHQWSIPVGPDGTFSDSTYVVDEGDLNVTFTLVATSQDNAGQSLSVTFTDGNLNSVALTPASRIIPTSGTAVYSINVDMNGSGSTCTVTLGVLPSPALPAGVSVSLPDNVVNATNTDFSRTLTLTASNVTPGSYQFTVQAARGANCSGSGNVTVGGTLVVFGAAAKLAFVQQPSNTSTVNTITPAVSVEIRDANDNPVPTSTLPVTIAIGTNAGGGTLSGTLTQNAVAGLATFPGLSINKVGTGYTLAASSAGLTGATSTPFSITAGTIAGLAFTSQPSDGTAGVVLPGQPVVTVQDPSGNTVTSGQGNNASISLTIVSGSGSSGAVLTCTQNPRLASAGMASFAGCRINLVGSDYQLQASTTVAGTTYTATSDPFDVVSADAQAPTVNCSVPNPSLWYGANQNVPCTASDAGSGLANSADASFTLSTNVGPGVETDQAGTQSRSVCDKNGNCTGVGPFSFKVDRKSPVVSCGSADAAWHANDVTIHCTSNDGGSGVTPGDEGFDLTTSVAANTETSSAATNSRNVTDIVGNAASAGPVSGNKVDKKAPALSCGQADGTWHATNVSIHCTATDDGSGVAGGASSFDLTTSVAAGTETADAQTNDRTVLDEVGNSVKAGPIGGNQVDRKAPGFTCDLAPAAWSANDVTRKCAAGDQGSGLAVSTPTLFDLSTDVPAGTEDANAETGTKELADVVGNTVTAGPLGGNKVDKKAPTFTCGAPDGQWHANDVSIACTGTDAGSGFGSSGSHTFGFSLETHVSAGTETDNAPTDTEEIADVVGNKVTAPAIPGNQVDKKAPTFACGTPDGQWHANDVSIACTAADGGSGVSPAADKNFSLRTSVDNGVETPNALTESRQISDGVGNKVTAPAIAGNMVDKKAPKVTCGSADGDWHANDPSIGCTASDGGSGLQNASDASFSLSTDIPNGTETANAATGTRNVADLVGNSATGGPITGNKVDKKGPSVTLTCPASPLQLNQPVTTKWIATDGGSDVSGANAQDLAYPVPTSPVGPKTLTVPAATSHDNVGNPSSASNSCDYGVNYVFGGFFAPVDNAPMKNGANSGQAIPLKWTLKDYSGNPVTTLSSVTVSATTLSCTQGTTDDLIEEYAAGASGLINKGDGSYQFNWKTPTSYAKSCKTLKLDLGDGSPKTALFDLKK